MFDDVDLEKRLDILDYYTDKDYDDNITDPEFLSRVINWVRRSYTRFIGILTNPALHADDILGPATTVTFKESEAVINRAIKIREAMPRNMYKTQAEFNRVCYRLGIEKALQIVGCSFPIKDNTFDEMAEAHNKIFRVKEDIEKKRIEQRCDEIEERCNGNKENRETVKEAKLVLMTLKEPKSNWNTVENVPVQMPSYDEVKQAG